MKKIFIILFFIMGLFAFSFAQEVDDFVVIPEAKKSEEEIKNIIKDVAGESNGKNAEGSVWDRYNQKYKEIKDDLGTQFKTGIFGWDSILLFIKYLIKFLSQAAMLIGALMIIYAGYIYATGVFTGNTGKGADAIKNAVIGTVIVISSYAIMKILVAFFL